MIQLYKRLPLVLQHLAVTVKNTQTYYKKFRTIPYVRPLKNKVKDLDPKGWINDCNEVERVNQLIETAVKNVPFYKENKEQYHQIDSISQLQELPILKKSILRERNTDFISLKSNKRNTYYFRTSGSTGTPLKGAVSLDDLHARFNTFLASLKLQNIDYSKRVGRFLGAEVGDAKNVYRKDFLNKHFLFSIYHISNANIYRYYKALQSNKIEIIEGYPSTICALIKFLKSNGLILNHVKHVLSTAEKLLDYQKSEIEEYFNCKVFDFYGSSEGSSYMYFDGKHYINANKVGIIEVVDENYNPVPPGTLGRMLVTSFTSSFTPLIRYDIGDYCIISEDYQPESHQILVDELIGRSEDVFETAEGVLFTRFSLCLKYLPSTIVESQLCLVQRRKDVLLKYTRTLGKIEQLTDFKDFERKFISILGEGYNFKYQYLEKFNKTSRGKLRAVTISNVDENGSIIE